MTTNSSHYHCPKCNNTVEVFIRVIAVRCWRCNGKPMKLAKVPIQPNHPEVTAGTARVAQRLF